jgi:hypothetical protein
MKKMIFFLIASLFMLPIFAQKKYALGLKVTAAKYNTIKMSASICKKDYNSIPESASLLK